MNQDELRTIAHRAMALVPAPLLRYRSGARHEVREGVAFVSWAIPGPSFNKVAVFGPSPSLDRVLELAAEFFGADPASYGVMVEADAGHPIEAELRSRGWSILEDEPAMVLPSLPSSVAIPPELQVRRVSDAETRREFVKACAAGFAAPTTDFATPTAAEEPGEHSDSMESMMPSLASALDPDIALMVGLVDGKPVATAMMYRIEETATLTGVATIPAYRRRGYAKVLTWAAIAEGAARGCRQAALNGLGASYLLYRGMGFEHVCNHRTYVAPAVAQRDR